MRSGACEGKLGQFAEELVNFTVAQGFANVVVLTSTISPVKRGRNTNGDIPEIYAYVNNFLQKTSPDFYEKNKIQKFGTWI